MVALMRNPPIRLNGAKMAEARIRAGMSQSVLAAHVGVNRSAINRIESGTRNPGPALLVALAAALGCEIDDITERVAA